MSNSRSSGRRPSPSSQRRKQMQGGASAAKRRSAQQRLAAERQAAIEAREAEARRRRLWLALIPVAVVVVVVVALVAVKAFDGKKAKSGAARTLASKQLVTDVTTVPLATFNAVGAGGVSWAPTAIKNGPNMTDGGKVRFLYVGAEFCPYCAAERWAVAVALSRFGTFSRLSQTESAGGREVYPNTRTLSFYGSSYTSDIVSFTAVETESNQAAKGGGYQELEKLSAADEKLMKTYDAPPYVSEKQAGSIPFILIGGKFTSIGSSYDPAVLEGKTHAEIAGALKDPKSKISQSVVGAANIVTASICTLTRNAPQNVCTSSGVTTAASKLG